MSAKELLQKLESGTATDADVLAALRAFVNESFSWGRIASEFNGHIKVACEEYDRLDCVSLAMHSALYAAGVVERLLPPKFADAAEQPWTTY